MLPKLIHQSFPSNRRIRVTFADPEQYDVYLADFDGLWFDTELLPQASMLANDIAGAHLDMLSEDLGKRFISLEDAYGFSPTTRSLAFTLHAAWVPETSGGPGVNVCYGGKWANPQTRTIPLPQVVSTEPITLLAAELEMEVWRIQKSAAPR